MSAHSTAKDTGGWKRGARGIDGRKGETFVDSQRDRGEEKRQLGKGYWSGSDNGSWGKE